MLQRDSDWLWQGCNALSAQVTHYSVVAEHCPRRSVIAELFDSVDAAEAAGAAEGGDEEGTLSRAAGNGSRDNAGHYFHSLPFSFCFSY